MPKSYASEIVSIVGLSDKKGKERYYNVPTVKRIPGRFSSVEASKAETIPMKDAVSRAKKEGILGEGFKSVQEADDYEAKRHSKFRPGMRNQDNVPMNPGGEHFYYEGRPVFTNRLRDREQRKNARNRLGVENP